ncbi:glycoside hydrolase family 53 protein [Uliginosibacterium gangwonense]|uniref:glycoside hydrolase family 53 protein n=1 Tax=Uliginosibacterium gangwonense TaxID=392736 RepID=UPI000372CE4E|nr:arabinogalactan endo-1,4-beta-galactosidase [Uliginosibacterium gangwonense]
MFGSKFLACRVLGLSLGLCFPWLAHAGSFAKGADVSWVDQEEASGYKFYNNSGIATDPFVLLKNVGVNAIRLRVWVNPSGGWNNGSDVLYKAKRAAAQGQRIMIDFHYSDTWADPGHQTKPSAWSSHTYSQLSTDVYNHTYGTLKYLKDNGIAVSWVQVGNEINGGMLWPEGKTSNFSQLAGLINSGYNATKAVYPNASVVLHLANGYNNKTFRSFFDAARSAGAKWDVIGMSFYPPVSNWADYSASLAKNMSDMIARYGKPVMVCEIGMDWTRASTAKSMVSDVVSKVQALGRNGLGVFYWEPEAYPGWQGYTMGATDAHGKLTSAMDPL